MTKGKAARIDTVLLESSTEADPAVREQNCQFILHTNVIEVIDSGTFDITNPRPRSVQVGGAPGEPRDGGSDENRATVSYRIMRAGELEEWASGVVRAHDPSPDQILISQLMNQTANRVADELRRPH